VNVTGDKIAWLEIEEYLKTDTIVERTLGAGVTVESDLILNLYELKFKYVLLKDIGSAIIPYLYLRNIDDTDYASLAVKDLTVDSDAVIAGSLVASYLGASEFLLTDTINEYHTDAGVTIEGVLLKDQSITSLLADATAISLGDPTHEGGDILVYKDAVGGIAFQLDADAVEIGFGSGSVADKTMYIQSKASDTYSLHVDHATNDYDGIASNQAVYVSHHISAGDTDVGFTSHGLFFGLAHYRNFVDAIATMVSIGIRGSIIDYGDFKETVAGASSATRTLRGMYFIGDARCVDLTAGFNTIDNRGAWILGRSFPRVDKTGGELAVDTYGAYIHAVTNPFIVAGEEFFIANTYGAYIEGVGTTEGTSTVYGIYVKAGGGDTNWSGYFVGADVYIEKNFDLDGIAYIDELRVEEVLNLDAIDIPATSVSGLSAVVPVVVGGVTKYIPCYDSYA